MTEVFRDIMFGLLAFTLPLALYVAYLDVVDWRQGAGRLALSRALTRIGWVVSLGAIAFRWALHLQPVEQSALGYVFFLGLLVSCVGFLGVAVNYHNELRKKEERR